MYYVSAETETIDYIVVRSMEDGSEQRFTLDEALELTNAICDVAKKKLAEVKIAS